MASTGDYCLIAGIYRCERDHQRRFQQDQRFSDCRRCPDHKVITWRFVSH